MCLKKELYLDVWDGGSVFAYVGRKVLCASCQEHWYESTCSRCDQSYRKAKDILGLDFHSMPGIPRRSYLTSLLCLLSKLAIICHRAVRMTELYQLLSGLQREDRYALGLAVGTNPPMQHVPL